MMGFLYGMTFPNHFWLSLLLIIYVTTTDVVGKTHIPPRNFIEHQRRVLPDSSARVACSVLLEGRSSIDQAGLTSFIAAVAEVSEVSQDQVLVTATQEGSGGKVGVAFQVSNTNAQELAKTLLRAQEPICEMMRSKGLSWTACRWLSEPLAFDVSGMPMLAEADDGVSLALLLAVVIPCIVFLLISAVAMRMQVVERLAMWWDADPDFEFPDVTVNDSAPLYTEPPQLGPDGQPVGQIGAIGLGRLNYAAEKQRQQSMRGAPPIPEHQVDTHGMASASLHHAGPFILPRDATASPPPLMIAGAQRAPSYGSQQHAMQPPVNAHQGALSPNTSFSPNATHEQIYSMQQRLPSGGQHLNPAGSFQRGDSNRALQHANSSGYADVPQYAQNGSTMQRGNSGRALQHTNSLGYVDVPLYAQNGNNIQRVEINRLPSNHPQQQQFYGVGYGGS